MNEIKLIPKGFAGVPKRIFSEIQKRVMLVFPEAWNLRFKAGHFTEEGKEKYQYALRAGERPGALPKKGSYTAKKLRLYGHQLALVFTGQGMRDAIATDGATSGRTHGGELWAKASLPNIFNLRNPQGRTNPPQEVTAILPGENAMLDGLAQKKLDAEIRRRSDERGFVS